MMTILVHFHAIYIKDWLFVTGMRFRVEKKNAEIFWGVFLAKFRGPVADLFIVHRDENKEGK